MDLPPFSEAVQKPLAVIERLPESQVNAYFESLLIHGTEVKGVTKSTHLARFPS